MMKVIMYMYGTNEAGENFRRQGIFFLSYSQWYLFTQFHWVVMYIIIGYYVHFLYCPQGYLWNIFLPIFSHIHTIFLFISYALCFCSLRAFTTIVYHNENISMYPVISKYSEFFFFSIFYQTYITLPYSTIQECFYKIFGLALLISTY